MATTLNAPGNVKSPPKTTSRVSTFYNSYLFRKTVKAFFTAFVAITLTFFLVRLLPSNPIELFIQDLMVQYSMPYHQARDQAASLFAIDLDQPLILQYFDYMQNLLRGDLGTSILSPGTPVSAFIKRFLPWTVFSVGIALIISFTIGIVLGLLMAYRREGWLDHILTVIASVLSSIPNYILGIMLIIWLGVRWGVIPVAQMRGSLSPGVQPEFSLAFFQDALYHAALPITTYVLTTMGNWMLTMKSSTISVLEEDYVTVARAKGLKESRITTAYVGRNASLPMFTLACHFHRLRRRRLRAHRNHLPISGHRLRLAAGHQQTRLYGHAWRLRHHHDGGDFRQLLRRHSLWLARSSHQIG